VSAESEAVASRPPLSRDRVLHAAVELADRDGIGALTMRNLAQELGVEAMSLYHHVRNKEAVLDGAVEVVVEELLTVADATSTPPADEDWRAALRGRILAARTVLFRHPWAPAVIETRASMIPSVVRWFESVLAIMRAGGLSYDLAHHGLHALGSRALGFTQELFAPPEGEDDGSLDALAQLADEVPHLIAMVAETAHDDPDATLGWCDDQAEFEFGLDLLLDGLERRRAAS
jgi:AcrR family transcriptional regulator